MTTFTVDEKCNRCGLCILECPAGIIESEQPEALPSWVEGGEERCIVCGHCVAVCPVDAVSLDTMRPEECPLVRRESLPSAEQVELLLKSRRSVRACREQPVPRELLAKLIDIARYAPSGHNAQPVQWLVIEDTKEVRRLSGLVADWMRRLVKAAPEAARLSHFDLLVADWDGGRDRIMRGAPHAIVAHAPKDDPGAQEAGAIALTYLELAAYSLGLGACWAGYFQGAAVFYRPMTEALHLPEGHGSLGAMMIGYPSHRLRRIPLRNQPRITWR